MTIRMVICHVIQCDTCDTKMDSGEGDFEPHYEHVIDAKEAMEYSEWTSVKEKAWCPDCSPPMCECGHAMTFHGNDGADPCEDVDPNDQPNATSPYTDCECKEYSP